MHVFVSEMALLCLLDLKELRRATSWHLKLMVASTYIQGEFKNHAFINSVKTATVTLYWAITTYFEVASFPEEILFNMFLILFLRYISEIKLGLSDSSSLHMLYSKVLSMLYSFDIFSNSITSSSSSGTPVLRDVNMFVHNLTCIISFILQ